MGLRDVHMPTLNVSESKYSMWVLEYKRLDDHLRVLENLYLRLQIGNIAVLPQFMAYLKLYWKILKPLMKKKDEIDDMDNMYVIIEDGVYAINFKMARIPITRQFLKNIDLFYERLQLIRQRTNLAIPTNNYDPTYALAGGKYGDEY